MKYIPTIGLEIHAELNTLSKMFCGCLNDANESHPNVNICPICMAHPGTLPVINKEAVKKVLLAGKALGGKWSEYTRFDRKNYFYPDLPKGYQISQNNYPLALGGELLGVRITRIHLEEDAGKLVHAKDGSLVDFNRAGRPLMELVTEPDIKSGEEAANFARELQLIFRYLGISDADMEKGQMRVEANISIKPSAVSHQPSDLEAGLPDASKLGVKVEVKNLNSFRSAEKAINYEIERQAKLLDAGEKIIQETRGWDDDKQITFSQRVKEESHDYRYFPEPDLPPLNLATLNLGEMVVPEMPEQKRKRFKKEYGLNEEQTEFFINDKKFAGFFEAVVSELKSLDIECSERDLISSAVNYLTSDLRSLVKEKMISFGEILLTPENFAELIGMISGGEITSRVGKDVLRTMVETGGDPSVIVDEKGLRQMGGEKEIEELADKIIKENPKEAEEYKNGKEALLQFLVGQGMKETKGSVNPKILGEILKKRLK